MGRLWMSLSAVVLCAFIALDGVPQKRGASSRKIACYTPFCSKVCAPNDALCKLCTLDIAPRGLLYDVFDLHRNLISFDSFKVVATVLPIFVAARLADCNVHRYFYERKKHKNKNQLWSGHETLARTSIALPLVALAYEAYFKRRSENACATARFMLLGFPFVVWTKTALKTMKNDMCLRPWNEHFSRTKRALGGFPSGHMAEATFTSVLFGLRFGFKAAFPTALLAAYIGITFVGCNRHYLSQMVAGAGLGALYAFAADRVIEKRLSNYASLGMEADANGGVWCSFKYRF